MFLSVILSTYNAPDWLEKVLWGYAAQTHRDFEIILADDGSASATRARIDQLRAQTGLSLTHVWQRDDGFRKCRILNKAILHARGEYLVFSDGDCIPRRDFLAVHAHRARRGHSLSGGYCKLSLAASQAITPADIRSGACFSLPWLRAHGHRTGRKDLKLVAPPQWAPWLHRLTTTRCNFKGSNGSAWKSDVLAVNGFDERMAYGSEDREFGVRLRNLGITPLHVRYDAIVVHLEHGRAYRDEAIYARNRRIRRHSERHQVIRTPQGISQLRAAGYQPSSAPVAAACDA